MCCICQAAYWRRPQVPAEAREVFPSTQMDPSSDQRVVQTALVLQDPRGQVCGSNRLRPKLPRKTTSQNRPLLPICRWHHVDSLKVQVRKAIRRNFIQALLTKA